MESAYKPSHSDGGGFKPRLPDGSEYPSLAAYDLLECMEAERTHGRPLVYVLSASSWRSADATSEIYDFFKKWVGIQMINAYGSITQFERLVEVALRAVIRGERVPADEPMPVQGAGPHFVINAAARLANATAIELDSEGNNIGRIRQLIPLVLESADDLTTRLASSANAFSELIRDVGRYREAICMPESEIPWGLVWGLGVRVESAAFAAEREIADQLAPTLDDPAMSALQSLRTLHIPLILASAEGRELLEQADRLRMTREEQTALQASAVELAKDIQANGGIIEPEAASIVTDAANSIGVGPHAERGTIFGIATVRNLSTVVISAAMASVPLHYIGGALGGALTMGTWEAVKKSPKFAAATASLSEQFNQVLEIGSEAAATQLTRLAPFRRFVQKNEPHLRRIAEGTSQLRWMTGYIDYICSEKPESASTGRGTGPS